MIWRWLPSTGYAAKASGSERSSGQKPWPGRPVIRCSNATASPGNTAEDEKEGLEEIRTKPVWVIGQVRNAAAAFRREPCGDVRVMNMISPRQGDQDIRVEQVRPHISSSAASVCSKVIGGAPSGMSNWGKMLSFAAGSARLEAFANQLSHRFAERNAFHVSKRADDFDDIIGQVDCGAHHDDYSITTSVCTSC